MSQDDIFQTAKIAIQTLDALKSQYEKFLGNLIHSTKVTTSNKIEEKITLLRKSIDIIDVGIDEAHVMIQLDNYLQNLEGEKHKLHVEVKRLSQENAWLRNELGSTQKKLHESEQINGCFSIEIENLKFLKDIQQYDKDNSTNQIISNINKDCHNHEHDLINDLFPLDDGDDEDDDEQDDSIKNKQNHSSINDSHNDLFIISSQSMDISMKSNNVYEIPARLKTLHNLVIQYTSFERYEIAITLCRQTLDDLEKTLGHQHPDVATVLNILALVYRNQSKHQEAIPLLYEALVIREETLGFEHSAVAATLNNLAVLYSKLNKFNEAEPLCKRALKIRELQLGLSHPDVAKQLVNLALICENQTKFDEVELYYKRAIDIYTKTLGYDDSNVAKTKNNLASIYLKQQKYIEAEQLYKDILTCAHEKKIPSSLSTSIRQNDVTNSYNKVNPIDTTIVMTVLKSLGLLYRRQGFYGAAEIIDNCASRARKDSQAIIQALNMVEEINNL